MHVLGADDLYELLVRVGDGVAALLEYNQYMKTKLTAVLALTIMFGYRSVAVADDGGAAMKRLVEKQQHEVGPACALFSKNEVAAFLGKPVKDGHTASLGLGCQWATTDDTHENLIVTRVPKQYYVAPTGAPKYKKIAGLGEDAYLDYELGGWTAGAIAGEKATIVLFTGKATPATALAALRLALKRK